MINGDALFFLVELIGTIAFAISGAMIAIDRELDLFGVIFLGGATACGGGILRDILLGQIPPQSFIHPVYLTTAAVTSVLVFLCTWYNHKRAVPLKGINEAFLNFFDAMGLGIFAVIGVQNTMNAGYGDNMFFCVFLGMCTAVGGGMLRDMMSNAVPAIFRKHIYALPSIIGAIFYYVLVPHGSALAVVSSTFLVVVLRMMAAAYQWSLPKIKADILPGQQ